jgi:serine O-acetyltransferase
MRLIWENPGLQALMIYRMGRWLASEGRCHAWLLLVLIPIYRLSVAYIRFAYDILLDQSAVIGPGLYIGHFGGIRLRNCRIGAYCSIQQEVRLEPIIGSDDGPIIGNRVWIGAHARIIGSVQVGDRATVGAGALVTQDVAASCLLLGNPARIVQINYDNSAFL